MTMMPNALTGAAYRWGNAGNLTLSNTISFANATGWIPVGDCHEVNALFSTNYTATTVTIIQQWSPDGSANSNHLEIVESIGTLLGQLQPYNVYLKGWTWNVAGWNAASLPLRVAIPRPVCAHFVSYLVVTGAAPAGGDFVQLTLERQQQGQLGTVGS